MCLHRRLFTMTNMKKNNNNTIQALYDLCRETFTPSAATSTPSPHAIHKLSSLLESIGPADVGLTDVSKEDDRGHGPFGVFSFNRVDRWAQPITYVDIHEGENFTMCIFCFPTSSVIPLHDHPGMTVLSKVLYGSLHVKAYDWVEPARIKKVQGTDPSTVRLAKLAVDKVLTAPCNTSVLYPRRGGNLHCFTAITPCAVLDILTPPYDEFAGRRCSYYRDYPYSSLCKYLLKPKFFSLQGFGYVLATGFSLEVTGAVNGLSNFAATEDNKSGIGKEEEYAWLAEIDTPDDLYMRPGTYTGPAIEK